ncbi:MAG TPA: polysaccharide deacetylase family protein [Candidatus Binataceae bacterium]|nr:polysaccharide deacetylase family protein [Candidatus Binataceae bacterium]
MKVTLSFDNGPEPEITDRVLDALRAAQVRSTFFLIGRKLADPARRARAERAYAEGHWIGNHSLTHGRPLGRREDRDGAEEEIGSAQRLLGPLAHPDKFFRPFGAGALDSSLLNRRAVDYLCAGGFTCVLWTTVPRDWEDPLGWVERALNDCRTRPWSVVVLHDLPTGAMRQLDRFIARLRDARAEIVQEFPPECVPILRGRVNGPLDQYVAA